VLVWFRITLTDDIPCENYNYNIFVFIKVMFETLSVPSLDMLYIMPYVLYCILAVSDVAELLDSVRLECSVSLSVGWQPQHIFLSVW